MPVTSAASSPTPRPWPAALPDRLTALRDLLHATPAGVTVADLRRTFAGARAADLTTLLTTLAALGHARQDGRRWISVG